MQETPKGWVHALSAVIEGMPTGLLTTAAAENIILTEGCFGSGDLNSVWKTPRRCLKTCCSVAKSYHTPCELMNGSMVRLPCPSLFPWVCSNSYSFSHSCHSTISSSIALFSSCPQSFPTLGSFSKSQLFPSGGQNTGASASRLVLPMNTQGWCPLGLTYLISSLFKGLSRSPAPQFKNINSLALSLLYGLTSVHDYWN